MTSAADGSAEDADRTPVEDEARDRWRRPEPVFTRAVRAALGDARTVLDASGGSTGPYAPADRAVTAVGSWPAPLDHRPSGHDDTTADLSFDDDAFDAALTVSALHRWSDPEHGLAELRRVARGPVVVLASDPARIEDHWLAEYAPDVMAAEARRHPALDRVVAALGGAVRTTRLPVPFTCADGFPEAYYGRPERLLDAGVRRATAVWSAVDEMSAARSVASLRAALEDGSWDRRHGRLRVQPSYEGSLVLLVAEGVGSPDPSARSRTALRA